LQQDGGGRGVDDLAAGAGVFPAAAQRVVCLGGGEPLVDEPYRDRRDSSGQIRGELPGAGRGRSFTAG
jgi:hypothetical protein